MSMCSSTGRSASIPSPTRAEEAQSPPPAAVCPFSYSVKHPAHLGESQQPAPPEPSPQPQTNGSSQPAVPPPPGPSPLPQQVQQYPLTSSLPQFPPGVKVEPQQPAPTMPPPQQIPGIQRPSEQTRQGPFPGSLSDLVMSFETVKQKGMLFLM